LPVAKEPAHERQRQHDVGARPGREMQVGLLGQRDGPRVDDDQPRAALLRFLHVGDEVDAGRRGIHSPDDDQVRVHVVGKRDARHLAVEAARGRSGRSRANRAQEPRGAQAIEQPHVGRVLREHAVRAAVAVGQDALATEALAGLEELGRDHGQRFVPADSLELSALTLRIGAAGGVKQPLGAVEMVRQVADLGADEALGVGVSPVAVDLHHTSVLDLHFEAAGIGAVERAGAVTHLGAHAGDSTPGGLGAPKRSPRCNKRGGARVVVLDGTWQTRLRRTHAESS
jgi:hypothetical protein